MTEHLAGGGKQVFCTEPCRYLVWSAEAQGAAEKVPGKKSLWCVWNVGWAGRVEKDGGDAGSAQPPYKTRKGVFLFWKGNRQPLL